jgi:hypothetical protein
MAKHLGSHTWQDAQTFSAPVSAKRLTVKGTALVDTDFADPTTTGWGAGATIGTVTGTDGHGTVKITSGAAPSASPTVVLTFKDGTWGTAPFSFVKLEDSSAAAPALWVGSATTATTMTITYNTTPLPVTSYEFKFLVIGN